MSAPEIQTTKYIFDVLIDVAERDARGLKYKFPKGLNVTVTKWNEIHEITRDDIRLYFKFRRGLVLYCEYRHEKDLEILGKKAIDLFLFFTNFVPFTAKYNINYSSKVKPSARNVPEPANVQTSSPPAANGLDLLPNDNLDSHQESGQPLAGGITLAQGTSITRNTPDIVPLLDNNDINLLKDLGQKAQQAFDEIGLSSTPLVKSFKDGLQRKTMQDVLQPDLANVSNVSMPENSHQPDNANERGAADATENISFGDENDIDIVQICRDLKIPLRRPRRVELSDELPVLPDLPKEVDLELIPLPKQAN